MKERKVVLKSTKILNLPALSKEVLFQSHDKNPEWLIQITPKGIGYVWLKRPMFCSFINLAGKS